MQLGYWRNHCLGQDKRSGFQTQPSALLSILHSKVMQHDADFTAVVSLNCHD